MSKQNGKKTGVWTVVKQGKDVHAYVLLLRNALKYYLFFLWRLTDRLIQFVYWGVKGLKKYFTFLCWKMSRFAERWGQEEGEMTFSFPGSLTSHLLTAIGLSLAISTGIGKYSVIVRSLLLKGQLVMRLPLMYMCSPFHTCIKTQKRFSKLHVYSFNPVTIWWLFFTQLQNSMLWECEGVNADVPWLKMRHAASENWGKSRQREHECKERRSVVNYIKLPKPQLLSSSPASRFTRIISLSPLFSFRSIIFIFLILYISVACFFDSSDVSSYLLTPNDDHCVMIASSYTCFIFSTRFYSVCCFPTVLILE